jgi:hypothetical protein
LVVSRTALRRLETKSSLPFNGKDPLISVVSLPTAHTSSAF